MWIFIVLFIVICICVYIGLILALNIFLVERFGIDTFGRYIMMAVLVLIEGALPAVVLNYFIC